jgi:epoxyqueuosine reductase
VPSGIAKRVGRRISQDACPWNVRFAREPTEPAFSPREVLAGEDARALAREILAMSRDEFSAAFRGSPMKRSKLRGLKRNATEVLGPGTYEALREQIPSPEANALFAPRERAARMGSVPAATRRLVSLPRSRGSSRATRCPA